MALNESLLVHDIAGGDRLTRYLFSDSQFAATRSRVKPGAFLPAADGATSVFLTTSRAESDVWIIAETHVAPDRRKPVRARADLSAGHVTRARLDLEPCEPPPNHCNITGWPEDKADRMERAWQLSQASVLVLIATA